MSGLSQKADMALADITANGGVLSVEQNNTFIRKLIDTPTLLRSVRSLAMSSPEQKFNRIGFGSRILRKASQSGRQEDSGANGRYLPADQRSKPTTSQKGITTEEVIAEVRLPYELLEDNIERGNLETTILQMIAERAALDLEELIILGDKSKAATDPYLGLVDGVLKLTTQHVVDADGEKLSPELMNSLKKSIPTAYRRNLPSMNYFVSPDNEADYRLSLTGRNTQLGDEMILRGGKVPVLGVDMEAAALMPNTDGILTNPKNIMFGIVRNVRIEQDRDIRSREVIIVLTARVGVQIDEVDAIAKLTNLAAS